MTDYKKLVKALRCGEYKPECGSSDCSYWSGLGCMDGQLMEDAAAAIEALQAQLEDRTNQDEQDKILEYLRNAPVRLLGPIEPMQIEQLPKLGEWQKAKPKGVVTYSDGYAECSHCHETIWLGWGMNFCPHCGTQNKIIDPDDYDGAKMEVQDG